MLKTLNNNDIRTRGDDKFREGDFYIKSHRREVQVAFLHLESAETDHATVLQIQVEAEKLANC